MYMISCSLRTCALLIIFSFFYISHAAAVSPVPETDKNNVERSENDLSEQVVIQRTEFNIPHIYAENYQAAGYALGFAQMEDYGERVAELLLRARGEWARYNELHGAQRSFAIDLDASARRNYKRAVETWQQLEPDTREMLTGFAKGVNRYIELHPDQFEDWVKPHYTGYDVHSRNVRGHSSGGVRAFLNAQNQRREQTNNSSLVLENSRETEEMPVPENLEIWGRLAFLDDAPHIDAGSNVWALAPERTTSGNAILMRNPHLSWGAGYYEAQMVVEGKFDFYGDFRIGGALGIIGGFNQHLGWSTTNNGPDLDEVYGLQADPDKADHILIDGASVPLERERITVEYTFGDALGTETREFWTTPWGPVIHRENGFVYVIKSGGDGEFRSGEQFFKMMKATSLEEWQEAMKMRAHPSSNLTYADSDGNIYYVWNATIPDRPHESGRDTTAIYVNSTDQIWSEIVPWEQLPQLLNPEGGYLRNENDPFHFTNMNEILKPEDFPPHYPEPQMRLRSQLSHELLHNDTRFSLEDVVDLKHSMRMLMADRVKEDLIEAVEQTNPQGETAEALQQIRDWDNTASRDSRGSILFEIWWDRYVATADSGRVLSSPAAAGYSATPEKLFLMPWSYDEPTTTPYGLADDRRAAEAFQWAIQDASERFGDWDLAWGDVHRAVIGDVDVPVGGCTGMIGCFRVIWYSDHRSDDQKREVRGGDGWVFAVEFGEQTRAYTVLAYGQTSDETSEYATIQLPVFANNEMTPAALTRPEIEAALIREYRPGKAE